MLSQSDLCSAYARLHGPTAPVALSRSAGDLVDWAGLCVDASHDAGNQEVLRINERRGGLCDDRSSERANAWALAASCFGGPRGACVVSERAGGAAYPAVRHPIAGQALARLAVAIVKRVRDVCHGPTLTVLQAARQSTGRAIGVGLAGASPIDDCAASIWLYERPPAAGSIRL